MNEHDGGVRVDSPFLHVRVGGEDGVRVRFGGDEEDEIAMDRHDYDEYREVRNRVRARLRFFRHAFGYVGLNGAFVLIDWLTGGGGSGVNWAQWVALIWGLVLAWEFVTTFVAPVLWGRDVEERLIQRELRRRRGA